MASSTFGCAAEPEQPYVEIASASAPIMGGYVDHDDKSVVAMSRFGQYGFASCSGTLIAPNVVLTAQHCVSPTPGTVQCGVTKFGDLYDAKDIHITTRVQASTNGADYHGVREIRVPAGPDFCGNDQAILILSDSVRIEETPPAVPRVDVDLVAAEPYYAVGFGALYDGDGAPTGTRYRRDNLITDCVGAGCGAIGSIYPTELLGDTGVCSGDSGGPAFDLLDRVAGVASRGAPDCEYPIYGHVAGWGEWIKETTVYAAGLTGAEPPKWATGWPTDPIYSHPVGPACSVPEACPSGICANGYCTRQCVDAAPCPGGYECTDGLCIKIPEPNNEDDDDGETESSCSVSQPGDDPTTPIPWALVPLAALLLIRHRQ